MLDRAGPGPGLGILHAEGKRQQVPKTDGRTDRLTGVQTNCWTDGWAPDMHRYGDPCLGECSQQGESYWWCR